MKITLEPTTEQNLTKEAKLLYPTVTVENPQDELGVSEVISLLVKPALVAFGYHQSLVEEHLGDD